MREAMSPPCAMKCPNWKSDLYYLTNNRIYHETIYLTYPSVGFLPDCRTGRQRAATCKAKDTDFGLARRDGGVEAFGPAGCQA